MSKQLQIHRKGNLFKEAWKDGFLNTSAEQSRSGCSRRLRIRHAGNLHPEAGRFKEVELREFSDSKTM